MSNKNDGLELDITFDLTRKRNAYVEHECIAEEVNGDRIDRSYVGIHSVIFDNDRNIIDVLNFPEGCCDFDKIPVKVPEGSGVLNFFYDMDMIEIKLWFPGIMTMPTAKNFCDSRSDFHIIVEYTHPSNYTESNDPSWITLSEWESNKFRCKLTGNALVVGKDHTNPDKVIPNAEIFIMREVNLYEF